MNWIFLVIALFLLVLGVYPLIQRRSMLTGLFMAQNSSLAIWNFCFYLQNESLYFIPVNQVSQIQLISVLVFANGLYLLCYQYPQHERKVLPWRLNLLLFSAFSYAIVATDFVSRAVLEAGQLVFIDGPGYALYTLYVLILGILSLYNLYRTYRREPEQRSSVLLVAFGIALFAITGISFGMILPLLGNFEFLAFSTLGATFPLMCFAYAITKYDFLDITVIINRASAWTLTFVLIAISLSLVFFATDELAESVQYTATLALACFWAVYAQALQQLLLTTAKRKFIRGWYDSDIVLSQLADIVSLEQNRQAIFLGMERLLDDALEVEHSHVLVASRDTRDQLKEYRFGSGNLARLNQPLPLTHPLVEQFARETGSRFLEDCDDAVQQFLQALGYDNDERCVLIPFRSPEWLEGLLILGERSNQAPYEERDLRFFRQLITYMSAIFYRLTPMEKLEQSYFDNIQRLHEAEIQLIRAQKIESIVHATRQCHHEIRTPLNIIRLGIGRIRSLDDLEAYRQVAQEEIAHALEIVEETLTITDVESPSPDRQSDFNLNDAVQRAIKLIPPDRYQVHMELADSLPITGIFSDLQVVFANLVHNAMDAMPNGGRFIFTSRQEGAQAVVEVSDSGQGIPEENRERVWEPYFSGHATVAGNATAGRGWGLTIVNRIIGEHKGTINFRSRPGQGTTFIIKLPLKPMAQDLPGKTNPVESGTQG